jgi:hypothetical protein
MNGGPLFWKWFAQRVIEHNRRYDVRLKKLEFLEADLKESFNQDFDCPFCLVNNNVKTCTICGIVVGCTNVWCNGQLKECKHRPPRINKKQLLIFCFIPMLFIIGGYF